MRIGWAYMVAGLWLARLFSVGAASTDNAAHLRTTTTEHYRVTYWRSEQGLPQNTVNCLVQTRDGYLWIGTQYGLARFDGYRFTDFSARLCEVSADNLEVKALAQDADGVLWLHNGQSLISFVSGVFRRHSVTNFPPGIPFQVLIAHPQRGIWLSAGGILAHLEPGRTGQDLKVASELRLFKSPDVSVRRVVLDDAHRLWVAGADTDSFLLWQRTSASGDQRWTIPELMDVPGKFVGGLVAASYGDLWGATSDALSQWHEGTLHVVASRPPWHGFFVKNMTADGQGGLWVISEGPVQLHRYAQGRFTSFGRNEGLFGADDIRCAYPDREGNIWVGTGGGGLARLQPRRMVSLLSGSESTTDEVYSIAQGAEGRIWMATTYGVVKYQNGEFTVFTNTATPGEANLKRMRLVFERRSGEVLSMRDFDGLQILRGGTFEQADYMPLMDGERRPVVSLAEDAEGTLWIASKMGLGERRGSETRIWSRKDGLSDDKTFGLVCPPDGSVWVGTQNGGINQFKNGSFRVYNTRHGLLKDNAWPLFAETNGAIWVGTPIGLNRILDGKVASVTMRHGLFDSLAYCLLPDAHGNFWTFGNRGIWRVKRTELNDVADGRRSRVHCVSYGEADGMPSVEGNGDQQPNALALENGQLWFPMTRGVIMMEPGKLRENQTPPTVTIEEVVIDQQSIYRDGAHFLREGFSKDGQALHMPPGSARVLEVSFAATTFVDAEKTTFRCRLLGDHSEWRELDTRRTAVFTNLRPGAYRFQVEACNHHGYWSAQPAEFAFVLAPQFHQTWTFRVLLTLTAGASFGLWRIRRVRLRRRLQRLSRDRAVEAERNRIARDLHDDLGANLTGLAVQLDVAVHNLRGQDELRSHLGELARAARDLVDTMREVVWSINPRCDTLESFCAYLCSYAEKYARSVRLACRFDFPPALPDLTLTSEARHHLLLAVKEALSNVARHASATEVTLSLECEEGELRVTISDNGRGCSLQLASAESMGGNGSSPGAAVPSGCGGNGLRNMRHRMGLVNGKMNWNSTVGVGTSVVLRVPVPNQGFESN